MFNIFKKKPVIEEDKAQTENSSTEKKDFLEEKTEQPREESRKNFWGISFSGLKQVVSKTNEFLSENVLSLGTGKEQIDDDLLDEMEERLIRADLGVNTTTYIIEKLRIVKNKVKPSEIRDYLKNEFREILQAAGSNELNIKEGQLNTFLITGVNGAGKTTLIGKLAYRFNVEGKKVLVAAGDTFRAAAEDQLEIWTKRAGADIVRQDKADPASVVYDAIQKAKAENYDILLIDTAGRLHNKFNLMEELRKIKKIIDREAPDTTAESILVIDATTGQNGLKQAEVFKEAVNLTAVGLTKLDGSSKGGIVAGIAKELGLPIKLIGVGEKIEDLKNFNSDDFVAALFG
ncbi:MAG TPA: signal recognition particle-docking protein FtsY [Candidatus Gastranaerophilales bacterium]|nr:signal recognition particle-docking protein FtsY [Candidatus Gastranaerophilales bacterium]